jgi:predicted phage gp36 major capsid-like protein
MSDLSQHLEGLTERQGELLKAMENIVEAQKADGADRDALKAQLDGLKGEMATITAEREQKARDLELEQQKADVAALRVEFEKRAKTSGSGSKASMVGFDRGDSEKAADLANEFFYHLARARSSDHEEQTAGKAALREMNSEFQANTKATLGDTAAAGGNIVPNAVLSDVIEIATATNPYRNLLTVVPAGFVTGVAIPNESGVITRAAIAAPARRRRTRPSRPPSTRPRCTPSPASTTSATSCSATRAVPPSASSAMRSRDRSRSARRTTSSRARARSEPTGLLTAIGTSGTFVTSFTPSATTLAGSSAAAIAKATGVLANRARQPDGVVVNSSDFWVMMAQGTDSAGFFFSPTGGPSAINPTQGQARVFGLPVYADPNMPTDSMVVGEWKSAQLFTGDAFRVDVSTEAGTRWDTNETGFRGEEEIGFNATPYVVAGMFQRVTDFTP